MDLDASEEQLDCPFVFASARDGYAMKDLNDERKDMTPLFETIVNYIPAPTGDPDANTQKMCIRDRVKTLPVYSQPAKHQLPCCISKIKSTNNVTIHNHHTNIRKNARCSCFVYTPFRSALNKRPPDV